LSTNEPRPTWQTPTLTFEGTLEELVLTAPGKTSMLPGDQQENRKNPGL
jgi:hypothetical protein